MTICKKLAYKEFDNGKSVSVFEMIDKYSSVPRYELTISKNGFEVETIKVSKTTWKKRFDQIKK